MAEERRIIKQEVDEKTANIPEMDQKTAKVKCEICWIKIHYN